MNRLKKEIRKRGVRLQIDYPYLPFFIKGRSIFEPGYIFVDGVCVNSETATVKRFLNIGTDVLKLKRNGEFERDFE